MPEELTQNCGNCRYYQGGLCKRFPEQPTMAPTDWCGEWNMAPTPYPAEPESDATEKMEAALGEVE